MGDIPFKDKISDNGFIGRLTNISVFCNEKNRKSGEFLFECSKECEHNK